MLPNQNTMANHKLYRLLKRVTEGDAQAVETLYHDYGNFIYFQILRIVDNESIAEEILHEVFIHLIALTSEKLPRVGATSWLITVVHHTTISYLKKREIRLLNAASLDQLAGKNYLAFSSHGIEDDIIEKLEIKRLLSALQKDTRNIIFLRYQGYSFREIAEKMQMNPGTARSRYVRAVGKMKEILSEWWEE